jgi:dTDP-4-amino-4,6-dideoxygalactose transaminase
MLTRFHSIPRFALPYSPGDLAAAVWAVFRGGPSPDAFDVLGESPRFWTRSGRQALRLLLGALDLEPGSGVALPLFTDPSLVSAILAAGHKPVFVDIEPRYLTIDPKSLAAVGEKFAAVVVVHLFGQMADIPGLLEAANGAHVIEDAAHAPLSYLNGRMAGTFGLASFYSFASTKYWPAGGGGLAVVNDRALARRVERATQSLAPPSRTEELRNLLLQAAKAAVFTRPFYGFLGRPMRRWAEPLALLEPGLDLNAIQHSYAEVASRQAPRMLVRVRRQRENSLKLLALIKSAEDVVLPYERPGAWHNYHLFPVLLRDSAERAAVMAAMWRRFVDSSMLYAGVVEECRKLGYRGGCPVAESVAGRLITLPNHATLVGDEIGRVAEVFLRSLNASRGGCPRTQTARPLAHSFDTR